MLETAPDVDFRRLINAALIGRRYTSWIAALATTEREIAHIIWESDARPTGIEDAVRAEHGFLVLDARKALVLRCRSHLPGYGHGVTLSCPTMSGVRLLVTVLRTAEQGRFTEDDVQALGESANAIATSMARSLDAAATGGHPTIRSREQPAFFVLTLAHDVEFSWIPERMQHLERLEPGIARLPPHIETTVRELSASWSVDDPKTWCEGVGAPRTTVVVRTMPLRGRGGSLRIGVTVELLKVRDTIGSAAREFGLSPRELDVLALLLEGRETRDLAKLLHIAPSTATAHVKRMMLKTNSRNRAELVARALGWQNGQRR